MITTPSPNLINVLIAIARIGMVFIGMPILVMSCGGGSASRTGSIPADRGIELTLDDYDNNLPDTVYFKNIETVFLESNEFSLIRRIDGIGYDGGLLFVFDQSSGKVVIFDEQGHYVGHIQNIGKGPKDYLHLTDFFLDTASNTLLLLCDRPYKVQYYNYKGDFLREVSTGELYVELVESGGRYYCRNYEPGNDEPDAFHLKVFDNEWKIAKKYLPLEPVSRAADFFSGGEFLTSDPQPLLTRRFDNNIYGIDSADIFIKYAIDFGSMALPPAIREDAADGIVLDDVREYVYAICDVVEDDRMLMFQTNTGIFIYDKKLALLKGYKGLLNTKYKFTYSDYLPLSGSGGVAFVMSPAILKFMERGLKDRDQKGIPFYELSAALKDNDNPVLFICRSGSHAR